MSVRRRVAKAILGIATLSLMPLAALPAQAATDALPTITQVGHAFPPPPTTVSGTLVNVRISWKSTQGTEGICDYYVQRYRNGSFDGDFFVSAKFTDQVLSVSQEYQFYVWAVDCLGNYSNYRASNAFYTYRYTEADVQRNGPNWSYKNTTGAIGNRIAVNTNKGSSWSIYTCYTNFAWIAQKNPQGGTASVKVDGIQLVNVNLYSASIKQRQLVAKTFDSGNGCHQVTVTNTSTGARNQLNIDGIFLQYE